MRGAALGLALVVLLAGCSGGGKSPSGGPADASGPHAQDIDIDEDSPYGAISGYVVDDAIQLLDGARVALEGKGRNATAAGGHFAFKDLEPGSYLVNASMAGHAAATTSVEVRAGEVSVAKLQLPRVAGTGAYNYTLQHSGFVRASAAAAGVILDAVFDAFLDDNPTCEGCIFTVERDGQDVQTLVVDMVWDNTLPPATGDDLFLTIINEKFTVDKPGFGASVTSPYNAHVQEHDPAFNDPDNSTWWRFQVGGSLTQPTYSQQYDLFVTVFVNAPAPEGFTLR